jgi:hypothetical protein
LFSEYKILEEIPKVKEGAGAPFLPEYLSRKINTCNSI